jgi:hypothetical protein
MCHHSLSGNCGKQHLHDDRFLCHLGVYRTYSAKRGKECMRCVPESASGKHLDVGEWMRVHSMPGNCCKQHLHDDRDVCQRTMYRTYSDKRGTDCM